MRAIDLCAGAGGLSLGLQRVGFDVHGVELDADACATHRANVGPCEQASIVGWHPAQPADLVAGGVPCQSFSEAGLREGTAREDGRLYQELIRVGVEAGAGCLLMENVEGLLSWRDADGWGVIARIEQAMHAAGYETRRAVLCAADFGTPQLRYRVFIVGFRDASALTAWRWPAPTHASPDTCRLLGLKPWVTVREGLGLGLGPHRHGLKDGATMASPQGMRFLDVDKPAPTVGRVGELLDRPSCTITTVPDETVDPRASRRPQAALRVAIAAALDKPAPTVTTRERGAEPIDARLSRRPMALVGRGVEAEGGGHLSLEHRAALQGFPPEFVFSGATAGSKDKQCGNAVPPQLGEAVGRSIYRALSA